VYRTGSALLSSKNVFDFLADDKNDLSVTGALSLFHDPSEYAFGGQGQNHPNDRLTTLTSLVMIE
jgi:hypothetical protein